MMWWTTLYRFECWNIINYPSTKKHFMQTLIYTCKTFIHTILSYFWIFKKLQEYYMHLYVICVIKSNACILYFFCLTIEIIHINPYNEYKKKSEYENKCKIYLSDLLLYYYSYILISNVCASCSTCAEKKMFAPWRFGEGTNDE
jgi:hypothetical protein